MNAITVEQRTSVRASNPIRDSLDGNRQHPTATRADRADARWTVRVVLETDGAMTAIRSVRAIIFDRYSGASVLHTVWTDWQDVPFLVAHVPAMPSTSGAVETAAGSLADELLALLGHDATACFAALRAGDVPPPSLGMSRRDRQYRQIVRDTAWHDSRAVGRTDMSEAEAAQRTLTEQLSGQADRGRGDS